VSARIFEYVKPGEFDDAAIRAMGDAFDDATRELHDRGQPAIVREVLARRIIEAAKLGERDPKRLRDIALAGLPPRYEA
jgi:hypothetical protein